MLALHRGPGVHVAVSACAFDDARAAALEPGAPLPAARIALIGKLAQAGIPVGVSIAPAILGLTDTDIVRLLTAAKDAGATSAFYLRLKLPGLIEPALVRRVRARVPERAHRVLAGLDGFGAAPGQRHGHAHAEDPMEQIFCFTAERLGLAFQRGAPFPSNVAALEARSTARLAQLDAEEAQREAAERRAAEPLLPFASPEAPPRPEPARAAHSAPAQLALF